MPDFFQQIFDHQREPAGRRGAKKPWWLLTTSSRRGLMMAGIYLGLAVAVFIVSFFIDPVTARMFAVLWLILSAWWLASATAARRRQRDEGDIRSS